MSGFGGFCPLPIRLGGSETEGWTATQHARAAADLVAVGATGVFARITFTTTGGVISSVEYFGANGNGLANAPTLIGGGLGIVNIQWPKAIADEYEDVSQVSIRHARATPHGTTMKAATTTILDSNLIEVRVFDSVGALADGRVTVTVSGSTRESRIGHYDGATDKTDATRETVPYAWIWYSEYTAALGTGLTQNRNGLVHCRKIALARMEASVERAAEKINTNSHPDTADDLLGEWVKIMQVRLDGYETRQEIRQICAAKFVAATGNDRVSIDSLCERILGQNFVSVQRIYGPDLANPPANTFWPTINPGIPAYNLGGGTWFSERSQILIQVNRPTDSSDSLFDKRLYLDLFLELDRVLPAWATFTTAVLDDDGFTLDIDPMDGKGML